MPIKRNPHVRISAKDLKTLVPGISDQLATAIGNDIPTVSRKNPLVILCSEDPTDERRPMAFRHVLGGGVKEKGLVQSMQGFLREARRDPDAYFRDCPELRTIGEGEAHLSLICACFENARNSVIKTIPVGEDDSEKASAITPVIDQVVGMGVCGLRLLRPNIKEQILLVKRQGSFLFNVETFSV